jgi:hypothetical protein
MDQWMMSFRLLFFLAILSTNYIELCDNNHPRITHWNMAMGKSRPEGKKQHTTRGAVPNQACGILCVLMTRSWDTKQGILELRLASGFSDFKFLVLSASFHFIPKRSELK